MYMNLFPQPNGNFGFGGKLSRIFLHLMQMNVAQRRSFLTVRNPFFGGFKGLHTTRAGAFLSETIRLFQNYYYLFFLLLINRCSPLSSSLNRVYKMVGFTTSRVTFTPRTVYKWGEGVLPENKYSLLEISVCFSSLLEMARLCVYPGCIIL